MPDIVPTLQLNFAKTKRLDPRITFTRASTGTYYDANGILRTAAAGVPRFDHNPSTLESLGLLVEDARTNFQTYSEEFDNAVWGKTNATIVSNASAAPDGTVSMDHLVENAANATHYLSFTSRTTSSGLPYIFSFYAKQGARSTIQFVPNSAVFPVTYVNFDLSAGIISAIGSSISASISALPGGIYRCSVVVTATASVTSTPAYLVLANSSAMARFAAYAGDGTSGVYLWGAQLEQASFPTSYIKTTASAVTRNADLATMTGTNFSSWYNQTEGTVTIDYSVPYTTSDANRRLWELGDGTNTERLSGFLSTSRYSAVFNSEDSSNTPDTLYDNVANTGRIFAYAYKGGDCAASEAGLSVVTNTSTPMPVATTLYIGGYYLGTLQLCGHISRLAYFPVRLSNSILRGLST